MADVENDALLNHLFGMEGSNEEPMTRELVLKGAFGWPGGKLRSIKHIVPKLQARKHRIYTETFGGSGAVLLNKMPVEVEVFNDRHSGIISFYRCIRDPDLKDKLYVRLQTALYSREEFIWCRESWNRLIGEGDDVMVERAARWFYSMQASFAGMGRNYGRLTVAAGKPPVEKIWRDNYHLTDLHLRLRKVQFENQDWRQCCLDYDTPETVHYLDPPYVATETGTYEHLFSIQDHKLLLDTIQKFKGFVAISGYSCSLYDEVKWDEIHKWRAVVTMNAKTRENKDDGDIIPNHHQEEHLYILYNQSKAK